MSLSLIKINYEEIEKKKILGDGAHGQLWYCHWNGKGGGMDVVAKYLKLDLLTPETKQELYKEVENMYFLNHTNIVRIYGYAENPAENTLLIIMEYVDGRSLFSWLMNNTNTMLDDWSTKLHIAKQIVMAVNYSHLSGMLHRDLKSLNVLVSNQMKVEVSEFGLAKIYNLITNSVDVVTKQLGTIRWRAPETFGENAQWTTKSDVYSLGIIFWEIASRDIPFRQLENDEVIPAVINGQRPEIDAAWPKAFADLMQWCWKQDPNERPTCEQILQILKEQEGLVKPAIDVSETTEQ
jgi:serine/threonine protein kinase